MRRVLQERLGAEPTPENIVALMLLSQHNWDETADFLEKVLRIKKIEEQQRGRFDH